MDGHFSDRVRQLCAERGMTIQNFELSQGFANGYIAQVDSRHFRPKEKRLKQIASYFNVSPEWLLGEEHPITQSQAPSDGVVIPVLGRVAAGIPMSAVENIVGYEEISKRVALSGEHFALRISGDSMFPFIQNGDIVVVRQQNDADNDDIVIALINGDDGVCKKLRKTSKSISLISLNPNYDPLVFTSSEVDTVPVKIIGKVVEIRRSI